MAAPAPPGAAAATAELFHCARTGDAARAAYLLEACGASAGAHDAWQATPLFYASLCGHCDVARLLLRAGAACERQTYDGERCLYAALHDDMRRVLQQEGFAKAAARSHGARDATRAGGACGCAAAGYARAVTRAAALTRTRPRLRRPRRSFASRRVPGAAGEHVRRRGAGVLA
jgi:hypothetical protein